MDSLVRSSGQERGSSFGAAGERAVMDTATSVLPSSSVPPSTSSPTPRPFHALKEKCNLKVDVFNKFRDRFQFPIELGFVFPGRAKRLVRSLTVRFASTKQPSCVV